MSLDHSSSFHLVEIFNRVFDDILQLLIWHLDPKIVQKLQSNYRASLYMRTANVERNLGSLLINIIDQHPDQLLSPSGPALGKAAHPNVILSQLKIEDLLIETLVNESSWHEEAILISHKIIDARHGKQSLQSLLLFNA